MSRGLSEPPERAGQPAANSDLGRTRPIYDEIPPVDRPRLPRWLLLGAPKAGTTAFAGWLGQHPDAFLSTPKELYFFDDHWNRGLEWYSEQFSDASAGALCGEATPSYLYSDVVLRRIFESVPDVRLLAILRDPARRAWSQFVYARQLGVEFRRFADAVEAEIADPSSLPWPYRVPGYVGGGLYSDRIRAIWDLFGTQSLLVLFHEELLAHPLETYAAACSHIGLDPSFTPELRRENPTYEVRSVRIQQALGKLWNKPVTRRLAVRVAPANRKSRQYAPAPADVDKRLRAHYGEELTRLEEMLGRRLPLAWYGLEAQRAV